MWKTWVQISVDQKNTFIRDVEGDKQNIPWKSENYTRAEEGPVYT